MVQDSVADGEYAECLLKARYFEVARRPLELIETLKFSPVHGFVRADLHLARMARSAAAFGLAFDRESAMRALNDAATEAKTDLRVRLSLNESGKFVCTAVPLGPDSATWSYAFSPRRVSSSDAFARHKTNWRELYDGEYARLTKALGCNEVLFLNERGEVVEGSRTNVFIARRGKLLTPPLAAGALDGCLRRALIEEGRCEEATLLPGDLRGDVYLGNSLRGLILARRLN